MKNKRLMFLIIVVTALAVGVTVFAILNAGDTGAKQASQENATVTIRQGDVSKTFDLNYLKHFKKIEFSATVDTSKTDPEQKTFGGVPLITVLIDLGFDLDNAENITLLAADGYASAITAEEARDSDNVFLVYERDGEPTLSKQQGGTGPIEIVIREDQFSQRWCKFLMEIDIQ